MLTQKGGGIIMSNMIKVRNNNLENLPFGQQVTVKTLNNEFINAVIIVNEIAFSDGWVIPFEEIGTMEIYLGWL